MFCSDLLGYLCVKVDIPGKEWTEIVDSFQLMSDCDQSDASLLQVIIISSVKGFNYRSS